MNNRLNQFLAAENLTQAEFAKRLGIARAGVSHILQGRNSPSYSFILAMMNNFPALNIEWLLSGKGKMYKEQKSQITIDNEPLTANLRIDTTDGMLFPVADEDEIAESEDSFTNVTKTEEKKSESQKSLNPNTVNNGRLQHNPENERLNSHYSQNEAELTGLQSTQQKNPQVNQRKIEEQQRPEDCLRIENQSAYERKPQNFSKEIKKIVVFFSDNTFEEFKGI